MFKSKNLFFTRKVVCTTSQQAVCIVYTTAESRNLQYTTLQNDPCAEANITYTFSQREKNQTTPMTVICVLELFTMLGCVGERAEKSS